MKGRYSLTGYRHDRYHWEKQIYEDDREETRCGGLGEETHFGRARTVEPRLDRVSLDSINL